MRVRVVSGRSERVVVRLPLDRLACPERTVSNSSKLMVPLPSLSIWYVEFDPKPNRDRRNQERQAEHEGALYIQHSGDQTVRFKG